MKYRILRNAAICKNCLTLLVSKHVHDFVSCPCGNYIDGGLEYQRRGGDFDALLDLSKVEKVEECPATITPAQFAKQLKNVLSPSETSTSPNSVPSVTQN